MTLYKIISLDYALHYELAANYRCIKTCKALKFYITLMIIKNLFDYSPMNRMHLYSMQTKKEVKYIKREVNDTKGKYKIISRNKLKNKKDKYHCSTQNYIKNNKTEQNEPYKIRGWL